MLGLSGLLIALGARLGIGSRGRWAGLLAAASSSVWALFVAPAAVSAAARRERRPLALLLAGAVLLALALAPAALARRGEAGALVPAAGAGLGLTNLWLYVGVSPAPATRLVLLGAASAALAVLCRRVLRREMPATLAVVGAMLVLLLAAPAASPDATLIPVGILSVATLLERGAEGGRKSS
jgi:hypothetical protein